MDESAHPTWGSYSCSDQFASLGRIVDSIVFREVV